MIRKFILHSEGSARANASHPEISEIDQTGNRLRIQIDDELSGQAEVTLKFWIKYRESR